MKIKSLFTLLIVFFFSCNPSQKNTNEYGAKIASTIEKAEIMQYVNSEPVVIETDNAIEMYDMEQLQMVTDIKYVYLKSKEPIGEIRKILVYKDRIYILDDHISESVFIFDLEGNQIKMINDKGAGPNEYFGLNSVLTIKNEELLISDRLRPLNLIYTLDGEFVRKEKTLPSRGMEIFDNKEILHVGDGQTWNDDIIPQIVVADADSAVRRALPYRFIQRNNFAGKLHINSQRNLLFAPILCDTVYQIISDSTYTPKYLLKNKKSVWKLKDDDFMNKNANMFYVSEEINNLIRSNRYSAFEGHFYDNEENIFFHLSEQHYKNPQYLFSSWYWYDKRTQKVFRIMWSDISQSLFESVCKNVKEKYDLDAIKSEWIRVPKAIWNGYYIGVIEAGEIDAYRQYYKKNKDTDTILNKIPPYIQRVIKADKNSPEADDNQVLVFYKIDFSKLR
jgi:hypothetical protein